MAEARVRWLVGGRDADAVAGDMREEYAARGGGRLWYWSQALSCMAVRLSPHRRMLPGVGMDFRLALRTVRRNPGYGFTAMICLALAMGVNTVLFSFLNSMYFRRLPLPEADRIVTIHRGKTPFCTRSEYRGFRDGLRSMQAATSLIAGEALGIGQITSTAIFEFVSPNYPQVLRVGTSLGRWFTRMDEAGSSGPVAVISYQLWKRRFNGDPAVLGKQIRVDEEAYQIVGVAPPSFRGTLPPIIVDVWIPAAFQGPAMNLVARLAPGAGIETARAEMRLIAARLQTASPRDRRLADPVRVESASGFVWTNGRRYMKPVLTILGAVCGVVLLIACANVANLLLSRAAVRRREMALRQSLGATRARLFRETLVEGLVLAAGGVGLGLVAGFWSSRAVELALPSIPIQTYRGIQFGIDWRVALLLAGAGIASALLFSLPPAMENGRRDLSSCLKGDAGPRRSRQREFYSFAQVALSLTLLISTALLLRALQRVENLDPGFDPSRCLTVFLSAPPKVGPQVAGELFSNLLARARLVRAGVDVDRDQGLGFVDHDLAAGGQRHLALERLLDLALDVEAFEDRDAVLVVRDLGAGALGDLADQLLHLLVVRLAVDQHPVDFLGEEVAHRALDDVGLHVEGGGRLLRLHLLLDLLPRPQQEMEVADKIARLLAFAGGADDDAHALGDGQFIDQQPERAWQMALDQLRLDMPKASFDSWVRDTSFVSFEDGIFTIGTPNA
ncbi:MAG: ABC transporter permease, partial [Acidobacteriia bacterium]|nr:ABC transporter permease [Terriglobia bacterium]